MPCLLLAACLKDREFPVVEGGVFKTPGATALGARTVVHYWNFNNTAALLTPTQSVGGASLSYTGGGGADAVTPGSALNARGTDTAGAGLRLRNPAGVFMLTVPTSNYKDIVFSFATQRSGNGAQQNILSYSVDGTNFITDSLSPNKHELSADWQLFSYDFSAIRRVNNNPAFRIRIEFNINNTGTDGNDRYDNITIDGNVINPTAAVPELVHYWNFNNNASLPALITPAFTKGGGTLNYTATYDDVTPGSAINARNSDAAGTALRLRNPAGIFYITAPTTGYKNVKLSYAVMRTSSGAQTNTVSYTLDGTSYISTGLTNSSYTPSLEPDYLLVQYDFSGITGAANNPNFKIKVEFSNGNTGTSGNNRFDNLVIEGVKI